MSDTAPTNDERAEAALVAVYTFSEHCHLTEHASTEEILTDLLCDLRHLCSREGVDFEAVSDRAAHHSAWETGPSVGEVFAPNAHERIIPSHVDVQDDGWYVEYRYESGGEQYRRFIPNRLLTEG